MPAARIADVIVPEVFTPYQQLRTEQKTNIINSGIAVRDASLDALLAGAGLTFNIPSWNDLDHNEDENIGSDDETDLSGPGGTSAIDEIGVRMNRNKSWGAMRLAAALASADPLQSIGGLVSDYWAARSQSAAIATLQGVFADNDAAPSGTEHVQYDLTVDVSDDAAGAYSAGVTDFQADSFIDCAQTLGDSSATVTAVIVHSVVYARMQKNNLIDFIPDSEGRANIPTFLGRRVVVDDGMPNPAGRGAAQTASGVYHSWLCGSGVLRFGVGSADQPTEVERKPSAGKGQGMDVLHSRVVWMIHPTGYKYAGTPAKGGPSNASTANNLAAAGSWMRVFPERKMIKVARLITRES